MFAYCLLVVGLVDRTLLVGCLSVGWWVVGLLWRVVGGTDFACWLVVCLLVGRTLLVGWLYACWWVGLCLLVGRTGLTGVWQSRATRSN